MTDPRALADEIELYGILSFLRKDRQHDLVAALRSQSPANDLSRASSKQYYAKVREILAECENDFNCCPRCGHEDTEAIKHSNLYLLLRAITPPETVAGCTLCANGNDLPDGEYCRACGYEKNMSPLASAITNARGKSIPPKAPVQFDGPSDPNEWRPAREAEVEELARDMQSRVSGAHRGALLYNGYLRIASRLMDYGADGLLTSLPLPERAAPVQSAPIDAWKDALNAAIHVINIFRTPHAYGDGVLEQSEKIFDQATARLAVESGEKLS